MLKSILSKFGQTAFTFILFFSAFSFASAQAISCIEEVNISLNANCQFQFDESDILTNDNPAGVYTVMLTSASGAIVTSNLVTGDYLWTTLTAKITNASGNSCWGEVNVEDKLAPSIVCSPVEVECFSMEDYIPTATDNCSGQAVVNIVASTIENLNCDPDFVKKVSQTYEAVDAYGNTSRCSQEIFLKKFDVSSVIWPEDKLISTDTNLTCKDSLNAEGLPDIFVSGVPTVLLAGVAVDLFPLNDTYCNISIEYRDVVVIDFGCSKKIMRTWYLYEWTCNVSPLPITYVQTLEIQDTEIPLITSCADFLSVDTNGAPGCFSEVTLTLPTATDDCSGILEIDVAYDGGFINNASGDQVVSLSGSSIVKYTIYDKCDNSATCQTLVEIQDNRSPVAVCDQNSVVSLRVNGTAIAYSPTFDDGSYDDCQLYKTVLRRMAPDCNCERPTFTDLNYIGDHNGHYYYVSNKSYSAHNAIQLANAVDGQVLILDSQEEADWISSSISAVADSVLIGLYSKNADGQFTWVDHSAIGYSNWAAGQVDGNGQAIVSGNNVVLNENGEWEIVSSAEKFAYVLELSNSCGFSDKVDFCCSDAGTSQQVVFRAIDASGLTNDCMVNIAVQDKVPPQITCPSDRTFDCSGITDFRDALLFGNFTASDQCSVAADTLIVDVSNYNSICGAGLVVRTFQVSDASGSSSLCSQTLSPTGAVVFAETDITWPIDEEVTGCNNSDYNPSTLPSGFPIVSNLSCGSISQPTYDDRVFSFAGQGTDACAKIVRTWTIIDWCQTLADGVTPVSFAHQQTIKVINNIGPIISPATCEPFSVNTNNCTTGTVTFTTSAVDDCALTLNNVRGTISIDEGSDGTFDSDLEILGSSYSYQAELPLGIHSFLITYEDLCGNQSACTKVVTVLDGNKPLTKCKSISVPIQAMDMDNNPNTPAINMAMVDAELFIESVSYPCGLTSTYKVSYSDNAMDNMQVFNCDDEEDGVVSLPIFLIDNNGASQVCTAELTLQDPDNLCDNNSGGGGGGTTFLLLGCDPETFSYPDCDPSGPLLQMTFSPLAPACNRTGDFVTMVEVDYYNDGIIDIVETGMTPDSYIYNQVTPVGDHSIGVRYIDPCGNSAYCIKNFTVECGNSTESRLVFDNCQDDLISLPCWEGDVYNFPIGVYDTQAACGNIEIIAEIDYNSNGIIDDVQIGLDFIDLALFTVDGFHTVNYTATGCSDVENCTSVIQVICEPTEIMIDGCFNESVSVNCNEPMESLFFFAASSINCNEDPYIQVGVDLYGDGTIDYTVDANQFINVSVTEPGDHLLNMLAIACNDTISCTKEVNVTCIEGIMAAIAGQVTTEELQTIQNVEVNLQGANVPALMTTENGQYAFNDMPQGGSYKVIPSKDTDYLEGVSTLDLIEMQRHILGISLLDSPYKIIAADVDNSGAINGIDLIELRKLILGIYTELPKNTSWRILDVATDFPDRLNPFSSPLAESYTISTLESDMEIDFIGVKVGDVNNSAASFTNNNNLNSRARQKVALHVAAQTTTETDIKEIVLTGIGLGGDSELVDGFQMGLSFDPDKVEVLSIVPLIKDLSASHINLNGLARGDVRFSVSSIDKLNIAQPLYKVTVRVLSDNSLSEALTLNADLMSAEAYQDGEILDVNLQFGNNVDDMTPTATQAQEIKLYQNNPNPWSNNTDIKFYLPEGKNVDLNVFNLNGTLLYTKSINGQRGINFATISKAELSTSGVLYYELVSQSTRHVQKMILLD